jgi:hypothetical protein
MDHFATVPQPAEPDLSYATARKELMDHDLLRMEVPTTHALSLPVPTLRLGEGVFAGFAGPAVRVPRRPMSLGTPDRWWALHLRTRRLVVYALCSAVPLPHDPAPGPITVDRTGRTNAQLAEELRVLDELMDAARPAFLSGNTGSPTIRTDLAEAFAAAVTPGVVGWYHALAPDFFSWLEAR